MSKRESFYLLNRELRVTTGADGSRTISGLIPYNAPSSGLPWKETIAPGAFSESLQSNSEILLCRNHDVGQLFGNTLSSTLVLTDSAAGLMFRCTLPNTTQAADLIESVLRRDIQGVSFGMIVTEQEWSDDGQGNLSRRIISLQLFEISLCNWAAFPDAAFSMRSVPKALRSLINRSASMEDDDDEDEDCDCERNPDGTLVDPECTCDEDDDDDNTEDRSKRLSWSERVLLRLDVARRY